MEKDGTSATGGPKCGGVVNGEGHASQDNGAMDTINLKKKQTLILTHTHNNST